MVKAVLDLKVVNHTSKLRSASHALTACNRPTKIDKPIGVNNDLCSYYNKSNYQICHVNMLQDKAQMFDQYSEEISFQG